MREFDGSYQERVDFPVGTRSLQYCGGLCVSYARVVEGVYGAVAEQPLAHGLLPVLRGQVKRRPAARVAREEVRVRSEQQLAASQEAHLLV